MLRRRTTKEVMSSGTSDAGDSTHGVLPETPVAGVAANDENGEKTLLRSGLGNSSRPQLRRRPAPTTRASATTASTSRGSSTHEQRRVRLLTRSSNRSYTQRSSADEVTNTDHGLGDEDDQRERATAALLMTLEEKLFERLQHHGIRRCAAEESDLAAAAAVSSTIGAPPTSKAFQPCYFMCVPCETRVTAVLTSPPTISDLAATMHHCSSASHRLYTRYMCIAETDAALVSTPFPDPGMYTTIEINGVRALVSMMPGGSSMFHPDPLESEAAYHKIDEVFYNKHTEAAAAESAMMFDSEGASAKAAAARLQTHTHESILLHGLIRPRKILQMLQAEERAAITEHLHDVATAAAAAPTRVNTTSVPAATEVCLFPPTKGSSEGDGAQEPRGGEAPPPVWSEDKAVFPKKPGHVILYHPIAQFTDPHAVWVPLPSKREKRRAARRHRRTTKPKRRVEFPRWIRVATRIIAPSLANWYELLPLVIRKKAPAAESSALKQEGEGDQAVPLHANVQWKRRRDGPKYQYVPDDHPYAVLPCEGREESPLSHIDGPGADNVVRRIEVPEDCLLRLTLHTMSLPRQHPGGERLQDLITRRPPPSAAANRHVIDVDAASQPISARRPVQRQEEHVDLSQGSDVPLTQVALSQLPTYSQRLRDDVALSAQLASEWNEDLDFFDRVRNFRRRRQSHPNEIQLDLSSSPDEKSARASGSFMSSGSGSAVVSDAPRQEGATEEEEDPRDDIARAQAALAAGRRREYGSNSTNSVYLPSSSTEHSHPLR